MYTTYFGLREKPFSIALDPQYFYVSELHREALAHLLYGISSDDCFLLLTGDVGTGKTMVCRLFLEQIPEDTDVALIVNPRLTVFELLKTICDELEIVLREGERTLLFYMDSLNQYLRDAYARGRNTVLLIDEAQNLSLDLLKQLSLLTNLEMDGKKLLKIVLLGQAELRNILEKNGVDQISEQITSRYHLLPLEQADVFAYVRYRLKVAGEKERIFSESALFRVYEFSKGVPRLINLLCEQALLCAYEEKKYLVTADTVERGARKVLGNVGRSRARGRFSSLILLIVILCVLGAAVIVFFFPRQLPFPAVNQPWGNQAENKVPAFIPVPAPPPSSSVAASQEKEEKTVIDEESRQSGETAAVEAQSDLEERSGTRIRIVPLKISE